MENAYQIFQRMFLHFNELCKYDKCYNGIEPVRGHDVLYLKRPILHMTCVCTGTSNEGRSDWLQLSARRVLIGLQSEDHVQDRYRVSFSILSIKS